MIRFLALAAAAVFLASLPSPADAGHRGARHHHPHVGKVHYGGRRHLGYWRRGPARGYGFGFSSYRGDPFGSDDYFDGGRCYYVHHRDHCVKNRIFNGFWDLPTHR